MLSGMGPTPRPACLACAACLLVAGPASAEPLICDLTGSGATPEYHCNMPVSCGPGTTCPSFFTEARCDEFGFGGPRCRPACGTLFTCDGDSDCPGLAGVLATCERAELYADGPAGVCTFAGLGIEYCVEDGVAIRAGDVAHCHQRPDGSYTANWFEGDCDRDGCPNGSDVAVCFSSGAPCLAPNLGPGCEAPTTDAGVPDAGVPVADAGAAPADGGPASTDAGSVDAGSRVDAGSSRDGGSAGFDAGRQLPPDQVPSFHGGGGCACSAAAGPSSCPTGPLLMLGVLGAVGASASRLADPRRRPRARASSKVPGTSCVGAHPISTPMARRIRVRTPASHI
jgi:hypothetical protein